MWQWITATLAALAAYIAILSRQLAKAKEKAKQAQIEKEAQASIRAVEQRIAERTAQIRTEAQELRAHDTPTTERPTGHFGDSRLLKRSGTDTE